METTGRPLDETIGLLLCKTGTMMPLVCRGKSLPRCRSNTVDFFTPAVNTYRRFNVNGPEVVKTNTEKRFLALTSRGSTGFFLMKRNDSKAVVLPKSANPELSFLPESRERPSGKLVSLMDQIFKSAVHEDITNRQSTHLRKEIVVEEQRLFFRLN
jgi:hypothetical protein